MTASRRPPDESTAPGTLTSLVEQVVRETFDRGEEAAEDALRAGEVIGRYELVRELGRGGFGVVWEARDRELGRAVALKTLRATRDAVRDRRLLAEAEVAARLSHPNIVTVLDVGRCRQGVYLVQEYLHGATLHERLREGPLPLRPALRVAIEVARGLAHAHAHGVVHRDLSPGNVLLCDDGQVKILDLGMASALGRRKLEGGTPESMAPEQLEAAPEDERTDVFALGALLFRMLAGRSPHGGGRAGARPPALGLEVREAPGVGALVEAMLATAPTERPRDAGEVQVALEALAAELPREPAGPPPRVRPPPRTRWIRAGAAAGFAVAAAAVALLLAWRGLPDVTGARPPGRILLAGSSTLARCAWRELLHADFEEPGAARWRNGEFGGQGPRRQDGIPSWSMDSDWNQLFVPLGALDPDLFAVEALFHAAPGEGHQVAVSLDVFADPAGPMDGSSGAEIHGGGILLLELPGQSPGFEWRFPGGTGGATADYLGSLPAPFTGAWHVLRIEGSRSGRWIRASLDRRFLVADLGPRDLAGRHVCLAASTGAYRPAGVQWRHLQLFEGTGDCR